MSESDIVFSLQRPFPYYELSYPMFVVKTAVDEACEADFIKVIDDAFNPPDRIPPKFTTHEDLEADIAEGLYAREGCLVLYDGSVPVAAGQIRVEKSDEGLIGYIDTLGVPRSLHGRGYGREMTKHRIHALIDRGVSEIRTEVEPENFPMQSILARLGFIKHPSPLHEGQGE
jgi:ribosomal protein S18 acetylase RimI-like enzyme